MAGHDVLVHLVGGDEPRSAAQALVAWRAACGEGRDGTVILVSEAPGGRGVAERVAEELAYEAPTLRFGLGPELAAGEGLEPLVARLHDTLGAELVACRSAVVEADRRRWAERFSVTLSPGDASPAVFTALLAATRALRPALILREGEAARLHPFGVLGPHGPSDPTAWDPEVVLVVDEMRRWRDEYLAATSAARARGDDELYDFWLRKGRRSMLAVVLVDDGSGPVAFRGCNLEVSLPTGSLCAERNAIGTALAARPDLKRHHVRKVAVLSLGGPGESEGTGGNPIGPCGACREWLAKVDEVNPDLVVVTFTDRTCASAIVRPLGLVP